MRRHMLSGSMCVLFAQLACVSAAKAQPIGPFSWQLHPFCNVVTLNVTQSGGTYTLDGHDALCGAERPAPATGVAVLNLNGTIGLSLTIVTTPGAVPVHVEAVVSLPTASGAWSDTTGNRGAFAFNGPGGGSPRPEGAFAITKFGSGPSLFGQRANGPDAAPTAVGNSQQLLVLGGRGHDGSEFGSTEVSMQFLTSEAWTPTAHGTRISFSTTENGVLSTTTRMTINHDGNVGIGTQTPDDPLDVVGNIRIGTGMIGCVQDRDGTAIAGACLSDSRFKRGVTPFEPMLSKIAALRPVHFYWRADEFPTRAFGARQSYGLMAQEVEQVLPELVSTDVDGYRAVNYSKLPLLSVQAIKDLKAENDVLKAQLALVETRLTQLEANARPSRIRAEKE